MERTERTSSTASAPVIEGLGKGSHLVKCFGSFYIKHNYIQSWCSEAGVQDNLHNSSIFLMQYLRQLTVSLAQHLQRGKKKIHTHKEKQNWHSFSFLSWFFTVREQCGQMHHSKVPSQQSSQTANQVSQSQTHTHKQTETMFIKMQVPILYSFLQVVPTPFEMLCGKRLVVATASNFLRQLANEQPKTGTTILEGHSVNQVVYLQHMPSFSSILGPSDVSRTTEQVRKAISSTSL